ncbi:MAG: fluoride efflux transporter CrcB [Thermomicrobiales bacterium]
MEITLKALVLVSIGGAIGAPSRFALSVLITRALSQPAFPYATLAVNTLGSFLLAFLTWTVAGRFGMTSSARILLGTGLMGAFTTFSTFSVESVLLIDESRYQSAITYMTVSVLLCVAAAFAGMHAARTLA